MSHFSAAVFHKEGQSVEELMAPYNGGPNAGPFFWLDRGEAVAYAREHFQTEGMSDDECWQMTADGCITDESGNLYTARNPKAEWDSCRIGGRWSGILRLKNGGSADSGRVGDLDLPSDFYTFAVVTPDGKWYDMGGSRWFRTSNEERVGNWQACYKERFIDAADKDWILTICDCHSN